MTYNRITPGNTSRAKVTLSPSGNFNISKTAWEAANGDMPEKVDVWEDSESETVGIDPYGSGPDTYSARKGTVSGAGALNEMGKRRPEEKIELPWCWNRELGLIEIDVSELSDLEGSEE